MATVIIKEGDGHTIRVSWKDADGNPFTPTTVRHRVDCLTTGAAMQSWVSVTPSSVVTIDIPGSANSINNAANESEVRQVTVQANAGLPNQRTVVGEYVIPNNEFVS
jgi:hypothetical protein